MLDVTDIRGVRTLTMTRPEKRNALHPHMIAAMTEAVENAPASTRVLIITGTGGAFCAGADLAYLRQLADYSLDENRTDSARLMQLYRALYEAPFVVISRVNGHALGGGMGFLLVSDFVLALRSVKLGFPEVTIGFVPALVSVFLQRKVPGGLARELLLSGRIFSAEEAVKWHLVSEVFDTEANLDAHLQHLTQRIRSSTSPQSIAATKHLLRRTDGLPLEEALAEAVDANAQARHTDDFRTGLQAFLQKEKIRWD